MDLGSACLPAKRTHSDLVSGGGKQGRQHANTSDKKKVTVEDREGRSPDLYSAESSRSSPFIPSSPTNRLTDVCLRTQEHVSGRSKRSDKKRRHTHRDDAQRRSEDEPWQAEAAVLQALRSCWPQTRTGLPVCQPLESANSSSNRRNVPRTNSNRNGKRLYLYTPGKRVLGGLGSNFYQQLSETGHTPSHAPALSVSLCSC